LHAIFEDFEIRMYDENPLLARLFPVHPKANHTIAQFPVHNNLPDVRLRKIKFEFENPAKQVELLGGVGQFQDGDFDLGYQHRIDIIVNRVRYIMMKFVTGAPLVCDEIQDMTHLKKKRRAN
jgi:hypothetical protein